MRRTPPIPLLIPLVAWFFLATCLTWSISPASAQDYGVEGARQLMKQVAADTLNGNTDTLIAHAHPAMIALIGGEEKATAMLPKMMRADFEVLETMGFKVSSFEVGEPESVRSTGDRIFVLFPTTMIAEGDKGKFTARSHTLATKKNAPGEKWYLLRLGLPEARVRQLIPELPADFTWPEKQPPKFEKR